MNSDNTQKGYVALFRSLSNHWLWQEKPFTRGQAWIDILLCVNHSDVKVPIKNQLILCKRGECLNSLDTWAERWGWDKSKVRRFLKMLETDTMIVRKPTPQTTHLKVVNYDTYQTPRHKDETQMTRRRNAGDTQLTPNNNDKPQEPQQQQSDDVDVVDDIVVEDDDKQQQGDGAGSGGDDVVDFLSSIPESIKCRIVGDTNLLKYADLCGRDIKRMQAYLDYADKQPNTKSPVGLAIKLAQEGTEIPSKPKKPKRHCQVCGKEVERSRNDGGWFCSSDCYQKDGNRHTLERIAELERERESEVVHG